MAKGSSKQRKVWARMKRAAKKCKGKKKGGFKSCMKKELKKKR